MPRSSKFWEALGFAKQSIKTVQDSLQSDGYQQGPLTNLDVKALERAQKKLAEIERIQKRREAPRGRTRR